MQLFVHTMVPQGYLGIFDASGKSVYQTAIAVLRWESQTFPMLLDACMREAGVAYTDIQRIIAVVGPWGFTSIRTTTLVLNTIAYSYRIPCVSLRLFDILGGFPCVQQSSKREVFVQLHADEPITLMDEPTLGATFADLGIDQFYGYCDWDIPGYTRVDNIQYCDIIRGIDAASAKDFLEPFYAKRPNIFA